MRIVSARQLRAAFLDGTAGRDYPDVADHRVVSADGDVDPREWNDATWELLAARHNAPPPPGAEAWFRAVCR